MGTRKSQKNFVNHRGHGEHRERQVQDLCFLVPTLPRGNAYQGPGLVWFPTLADIEKKRLTTEDTEDTEKDRIRICGSLFSVSSVLRGECPDFK